MTTFKPILFSTPMVQALLEYRKNQTRRVIKGLDSLKEPYFQSLVHHASGRYTFASLYSEEIIEVKCPYKIGDVLWVRETFREIEQDNGSPRIEYKATETINLIDKWKPSLFMPKEACRLFLKVKSINVKRLHDISTFDIKSEGVIYPGHFVLGVQNNALSFLPKGRNLNTNPPTEDEIFFAHWAELWCKINGLHSWSSNPFVWVIEFEKIGKPNNFI